MAEAELLYPATKGSPLLGEGTFGYLQLVSFLGPCKGGLHKTCNNSRVAGGKVYRHLLAA